MFKERKTTALTRLVLDKYPNGQCDYIKVVKLLYLMDRKMIELHDDVITGDRYLSMRYGPVLSNTLNLIKTGDIKKEYQDRFWDKYIVTKGCNLQQREVHEQEVSIASDLLTKQEKKVHDTIMDEFSEMDKWKLVQYTHDNCPEWQDPNPYGVSDLPIHRILRELDKSKEVFMQFAVEDAISWNAVF